MGNDMSDKHATGATSGMYLKMLKESQKITSAIEHVTPKIAAQYLANNEGNRNIRTTRVKELSGIIKRGEWMMTHQGIAFSRDGRLLDGQHRLLACIDADMPIDIMVTRNLDPSSFKALDLHGKRTFADIFGIPNNLSSCLNFIAMAVYGDRSVGPEQIQLVMGTEIGRTCAELCTQNHNSPIVRTPWIVGCAVHCVNGQREYAAALFENIRMCNISQLPPAGEAFLRQHMNGGMKAGGTNGARREIFAKGVVLFDPKKSKNVIIKPMSVDAAMQMLRDAVPELSAQ